MVFRYHHLFSDFLIQELGSRITPTELNSIFSSAADMLYERNEFLNAIEVALRGDVYHKALEWIDEHILDILALGQTETFVGWVDLLVMNEQKVSPGTLAMQAFALAMLNDFGRALQVINQLEFRNKSDEWMTHKDYQTEAADFLGIKAYVLLYGFNDIEASLHLLLEQLERRTKESKFNLIPIRYNMFNPVLIRMRMGVKGKLWPEEKFMKFADTFYNTDLRNLNLMGYSYGVRAETLVELNRTDEALPEIKKAIRLGRRFEDPGVIVPMFLLKCQIQLNKQNYKEVQRLLGLIEAYAVKLKEFHWMESIHAMGAKVYLLQNKVDEAENELNKVKNSSQYIGGTENEFWWFVNVRLLISKKEFERGLQIINRIKTVAHEEEQISTAIEATLLQALLYSLLDNNRLALDALHESLELGFPYGYMRVFLNEREMLPLIQKYIKLREKHEMAIWSNIPLDYIVKIQDTLNQEKVILEISSVNENPLSTLTPRELEVLQHLTTGLSNREIATELYLSPGTIRIYLSNIYTKLQVNSRTQAVIIAKENELNRVK